jgi:hypothetical protein
VHPVAASSTHQQPTATTIPADALFVDPVVGDDAATGARTAPLRTIQAAADRVAAAPATVASSPYAATKTVVLRGGTHYLADTIELGPQHSGLHMLGHPGEEVVVSGGVELNVTWVPYNVSSSLSSTVPSTDAAPATDGSVGAGGNWTVQDNYNYVWNDDIGSKSFPLYGKLNSAAVCQAACMVLCFQTRKMTLEEWILKLKPNIPCDSMACLSGGPSLVVPL